MSKLNRKEFRELLTEWNSNFINERGPLRSQYKKELPGSLCHLPEVEIVELSNFVTDLVNFSEKRKDTGLGKMGAGRHVYTRYNFSVPKDSNILSEMLNFTKNDKVKIFISSALNEVKSGNKDPVVFFSDVGVIPTGEPHKDDQEAGPYIAHDLEHGIFTSAVYDLEDKRRDRGDYVDDDARRGAWNYDYDKDHPVDRDHFYNRTGNIAQEADHDIVKLEKIANSEDIVGFKNYGPITKKDSNAIKIEVAFKIFFEEINFAKAIGVGDIMPSVWAYCISRMENKHDLDEVKNSNISDEYKKIICHILENSHDNCMRTLNNFLQSQNDRIVFINTWG